MARTQRPTWRSLHLAQQLRRLRQDAELTTVSVAEQLGWDNSRVSRIENAKVYVTAPDVEQMLDLYGVGSTTKAALLELARNAKKRGWWTAYGDAFTSSYVDMEDLALEIYNWETQYIPGLLQTPEYARKLLETAFPDADDEDIERRLRARMARKPVLQRKNPPELHAVVDEAAFRRIGDPLVLSSQVRALLDLPPNVVFQVLPFTLGLSRGMEGSFVVVHLPDELGPPKAYCETPGGNLYVESAEDVRRCTLNFAAVSEAALSPEETTRWLGALLKEKAR